MYIILSDLCVFRGLFLSLLLIKRKDNTYDLNGAANSLTGHP